MKLRALCLVLLIGLCARPVVASPIVSIDPVSSTVAVGSSFFLDINIAGVSDLVGFGFDLFYDSSLLAATDVIEGSFLSSAGSTVFLPGDVSVPGSVTSTFGALFGTDPGASGDGTLARIMFTALAAGTSTVSLSDFSWQDTAAAENGVLLTASMMDGSVTAETTTASPVPEPGSIVLLGSGLVAAWRSRRRTTRAA